MQTSTTSLALFPLQTVLFPGGILPLQIFERRYIDLVRDCVRTQAPFGVVAISAGRETGVAAETFAIGTAADIVDWNQGANGLLHIVARGRRRFRILSNTVHNQLQVAEVSWLNDVGAPPPKARTAQLRLLLQNLLQQIDPNGKGAIDAELDASELAYRFAELLPLPLGDKVKLLEIDAVDDRVTYIEHRLREAIRTTRTLN
ncbi:MAG: LON peptidase substrate-binding domain-containing protein [Gammaproteobacteria bacterium]|nr:LON peptidase substrate-binding domain-containing protein [Gammaproteobacteria bacterium]